MADTRVDEQAPEHRRIAELEAKLVEARQTIARLQERYQHLLEKVVLAERRIAAGKAERRLDTNEDQLSLEGAFAELKALEKELAAATGGIGAPLTPPPPPAPPGDTPTKKPDGRKAPSTESTARRLRLGGNGIGLNVVVAGGADGGVVLGLVGARRGANTSRPTWPSSNGQRVTVAIARDDVDRKRDDRRRRRRGSGVGGGDGSGRFVHEEQGTQVDSQFSASSVDRAAGVRRRVYVEDPGSDPIASVTHARASSRRRSRRTRGSFRARMPATGD